MLRKFITFIVQALIGMVFVWGMALVMVEWLAGCGETYIDSKGVRHANECIFINRK